MRNINHNTLLRKMVLAAIGVVAAGFIATAHAGSADKTYLTFNKDVALPGVVLPAGTYVFDIANPDTSHDVVRVATRDGHIRYLGLTLGVSRPAALPGAPPITFGEARADSPAPIAAWFPTGTASGRQFIYR
jgi:hypothetical protein